MDVKHYDSIKEGLGLDKISEDSLKALSLIGNLDELVSGDKSNLVKAINEIVSGDKNVTPVEIKTNMINITQDTNEVNINGEEIEGFNNELDTLIVIKNSVVLIPGTHYTIDDSGTKIVSLDSSFKTGTVLYIMCFKQIISDLGSSTGTREIEKLINIVEPVEEIFIDIKEYSPLIDKVDVHKDGLKLKQDVDYLIDKNSKTIKPVVGTFSNCRIIYSVIKQATRVINNYDSSLILDHSIESIKLSKELNDKINSATSAEGHNHDSIYYKKSEIDTIIENSQYDDTSIKESLNTHSHDNIYYKKSEIDTAVNSKASFKNGTGIFIKDKNSITIEDTFITDNTLITVIPTSDKIGFWVVDTYDGYFTIVSDKIETEDVNFTWGGVK